MQIVILAAGRGTRMGKLTDSIPKPMLKINNKPILAHKIQALPKEIDEVILVIGYLGEQIRNYFGDVYDGRKIFYVEQSELNGSGGALHLAKKLLHDDFLVMMGDDLYVENDVAKIMKNELAILGLEIENPKFFGIIVRDAQGNLKEVVEKPDLEGPAFANAALYKLNQKFFEYPLVEIGNGEYGLPQTLALMAKDFPVKIEKATAWMPIGKQEDLAKAEKIIDKFI